MNIINQMDYIQQKVRESYCEHSGTLTPLDIEATKIRDIENPVTCDDCGKVLECEHEEMEIDPGGSAVWYCTLCGADCTSLRDYDDWRKEYLENE